ncbi:5-methyltetrahydropteroyltriglutamate--homocysteine S-methyltransferase [Amorphus sp. 3PC139-8]|uniref:5-methyltetrahydropteroyltriglutamate-- homocysteine S-methyltransferase n=1 Tax=Amorphus sp. 3PC139-8 TaxID=2735676 RepID=UPI00345CFE22
MTARPPFRADHVGSLLRPASLKQARKKHFEEHSVSADELRAVEDTEIRKAIAMQEEVGLPVVTDGELRRSWWHYDFMGMLNGLDIETQEGGGLKFKGLTTKPQVIVLKDRVSFPQDHPMLAHFKFVAENTKVTPKISIPGPSACHYRLMDKNNHVREYQEDLGAYFADLTQTYKDAVKAFYDVGCRYLQMDDIFYAYLCDETIRQEWRDRGIDPDWLISEYSTMMRNAVAGRPEDMVIGMHMCRGNNQSTWVAEGGYDPAAEAVFSTGIDVFFMEYDSDRAGGLEPLRLLPKGKQRVMPGFITTKTPELESLDHLRRLFDEASKYADLDQMGIAPQCGFSSTEEGNKVTEDDQRRKLELVVKTAEAIWGSTTA